MLHINYQAKSLRRTKASDRKRKGNRSVS